MSGIINPMNHGYFKKWKEYVEGHGGKIFCTVLGGGKVTSTGDRAIFEKYLLGKIIDKKTGTKQNFLL